MIIPFGAWQPDFPPIGNPHLVEATGCLPTIASYEPFRELAITTDALDAKCLGAVAARDIDQAAHMYAGNSTKLYELEAFSWTDRSKVGGYGPAGDSTRWRFATYGDRMVAVNGSDPPQYIDMSTAATAFDDLAGSPPSAQYIASFGSFLVLGSISGSSMSIKWCGFNDTENWTAGTGQSDEQEFAEGGRLTGLGGVDVLYIFQERAIRRMNYVGGLTIMQIDKLAEGIGCIEPNSLVQFGNLFFFLSEDGFYKFDGVNIVPIGTGADGGAAFDQWFQENAARAYWPQMSSSINPNKKIVCWAFCSTGSGGSPDMILAYNWVSKRATVVPYMVEYLLGGTSLGISPDDLVSTDADTLTVSVDDPIWLGGAYYFAAFDTDHAMGSFTGDTVEATFTTNQSRANLAGRATVMAFEPITDAASATVAGAASDAPSNSPTFLAAVSMQQSRRCPQRGVNGNYFAAKAVIPAGQTWTFADGVNVELKAAGKR